VLLGATRRDRLEIESARSSRAEAKASAVMMHCVFRERDVKADKSERKRPNAYHHVTATFVRRS
jgi:hypothetical protein